MINRRTIAAIILAAGKGKRMKSENKNKVTFHLDGKPLISYAVSLLEKMNITPIIIIVGHAKESVQNALKDHNVSFVEQKEQLGTGHAVQIAMPSIPAGITDILILYGDDSYIYNEEVIKKITTTHMTKNAALTFLTIKVDNPAGLGRIIRDSSGKVTDIIEEKDATEEQKKINEINPNCYLFQLDFLKKYLPQVQPSPVTGEYYLPALINLAVKNNEKIESIDGGDLPWKGVNTQEELAEANNLFLASVKTHA